MAVLEIHAGGQCRAALPMDFDEVTVGRRDVGWKPDIDLAELLGIGPYVSRRHVTFLRMNNAWEVACMSKKLDTHVNGEPLACGQRVSLEDGDEIVLGRFVGLVFYANELPQDHDEEPTRQATEQQAREYLLNALLIMIKEDLESPDVRKDSHKAIHVVIVAELLDNGFVDSLAKAAALLLAADLQERGWVFHVFERGRASTCLTPDGKEYVGARALAKWLPMIRRVMPRDWNEELTNA